jgi:hypothetical protein
VRYPPPLQDGRTGRSLGHIENHMWSFILLSNANTKQLYMTSIHVLYT